MHIKISRVLEKEEEAEFNPCYVKRSGCTEELIIPISSISLSKIHTYCRQDSNQNPTFYQVHLHKFHNQRDKIILVSEEEYNRIEKCLAFNNKKELEILSSSYPEINIKNAIEGLQLNED